MSNDLQAVIDRAWDERDTIGAATKGEVRQAVTGRGTSKALNQTPLLQSGRQLLGSGLEEPEVSVVE